MTFICPICSDFLDNDKQISALSECGHTFCNQCLNKWLPSNKSCPTCRGKVDPNKVIYKLYMTASETRDDGADVDHVLNKRVTDLSARLQQSNFEKTTLKAQKVALEEDLNKERERHAVTKSLFEKEEDTVKSLKKQVKSLKSTEDKARLAIAEMHVLRDKLSRLEHVDSFVNGCREDTDRLLCDPTQTRENMAVLCGIMRKEMDNKKERIAALQKDNEGKHSKIILLKREKADLEMREKDLQIRLKGSEDDLLASEQELTKWKNKVMENAQSMPTGVNKRLLLESPAPNPSKRSRLSGPDDFDSTFERTPEPINIDTPGRPSIHGASPALETTKIKIVSAGDKNKQEQRGKGEGERARPAFIAPLSIMHRTEGSGLLKPAIPSIVRQGFDGMGAHGRHVAPVRKLDLPAACYTHAQKARSTVNFSTNPKPALPSLKDFMKS